MDTIDKWKKKGDASLSKKESRIMASVKDLAKDSADRGVDIGQEHWSSMLNERGSVDVALLTPGLETGRNIKAGIQSLLLPTAKSPEHLKAAEVIGGSLGSMSRAGEIAAKRLQADSRMFDKLGVFDPKIPLKDNPGVKFMSDMSVGRPMAPEMQAIANKVKSLFEDRLRKLEEVGAPLQTVRENYFPGMWKDKAAAEKFMAKRPFKGGESFRKQKVFDDIMEGIDAGLEPISPNPLDLVKLKLAEMDRSIMANKALREFEAKGDVINVDNSGRPLKKALQADFNPADWAKINDKYGTIWFHDPTTNMPVKVGYRMAKKPVAEVMNNYLSSSLYNSPYFGDAFKVYMGTANALNQTQLGVFSAFHAGFTEFEVQISANANVLKDIYGVARGNRKIADLGKSIAKAPQAMIRTPIEGGKLLKEWHDPGSQGFQVGQIAKAAELAGAGFKMEGGLRTYQTEKMVRDWYGGNKTKAALRSPIALTELGMKPIMEMLVPRQKAGVFSELAGRIIEQNPGVPLENLRGQFRQAWNRVDARLGQVRYNRLFINNAAKNVIQGIVRAPGWTGGTIAEIGGAPMDVGRFIKEWVKTGKAPANIPDRVAYTLSLAATTAISNAVLTFAFTGEMPKGMDYWAFRDGGTDEQGRPSRFLLPTYAKDVYAWWKNPGHTALAKTHPAASLIGEIIRNTDYYGTVIANPDDPLINRQTERGKHVIKAFVPFWMRGAGKVIGREGGFKEAMTKSPEKVLAPLIGVMPATAAYTKTKAETMISEFTRSHLPQGARTKEQSEYSQLRGQALRLLRQGKSPDEFPEGLRKQLGKLSVKQTDKILEEAKISYIESAFKHLTAAEAMKIWKISTPEERRILSEEYQAKLSRKAKDMTDEEYEDFKKQIKAAE
jgi:hypothetical protein